MVELDVTPQRTASPGGGLATACIMWLWGALLLCAPAYVGTGGFLSACLSAAGWALIGLSFAGASFALADLLGIEAIGYWAVAVLVLFPAALIHFAVRRDPPSLGTSLARILTLGSVGFGGFFLVRGLGHFLQRMSQIEIGLADAWESILADRGETIKLGVAIGLAVLNMVTAFLKLLIP